MTPARHHKLPPRLLQRQSEVSLETKSSTIKLHAVLERQKHRVQLDRAAVLPEGPPNDVEGAWEVIYGVVQESYLENEVTFGETNVPCCGGQTTQSYDGNMIGYTTARTVLPRRDIGVHDVVVLVPLLFLFNKFWDRRE